ncbi:hypothetical protein BBJ28_00008288 [Nothophytophthora sp. Chile5]|nr:hypothetical protein BBJ28_00008288 [Nothophytophthora sp. Chile5]
MYEVKGRKASNFRELKEFPFSIGIEDGFMSKECVPQLFVVAKDKSIVWYGDPSSEGVEATIRAAMDRENVEVNGIRDEELEKQPQTADKEEGMQSIAA